MSLEAGTYVNDLDSANPPGTDQKKQGDDHLRLIKGVLKATFPNADRAWRMPEFATKSGTGSIATTDENKTLLCDTSGGDFTLTLPSPAFDGWMVKVMKSTTDANSVFVAPPSGNINTDVGAVAKIRISVSFKEFVFVYTGSAFIEFDGLEEPGTVLNYYAATAPVGYVFAYGQTLSGTNADYPKLYARLATLVLPDLRGRVEFGKDNMGSDAARLTSAGGGVDGDTLGAVGGGESVTLLQANLPDVNFIIAAGQWTPTITMAGGYKVGTTGVNITTSGVTTVPTNLVTPIATSDANPQMNAASGGSGTAIKPLPPGIVCNKIMRLC